MKSLKKLVLTLVLALSALALVACSTAKTGESAKIGVPDDATNLARALKLLESAGLIEVDPAAGYSPELKDVTKYLYDIEIVPTAANALPATLSDYAASVINGTYAIPTGLVPSKDALIVEQQSEDGTNPYVNIIAARTTDKDNATYKTVVAALQTQLVAEYMLEAYKEAFFPAFTYDKTYTVASDFVTSIDNYKSSKTGKTVVKIGVCGASNNYLLATQKVLDDENANIYLELVTFDAYNLPNEALSSGEIDLNSFQHKAYLAKDSAANKYDITSIGDSLIAPLSLYSHKATTLAELKTLAGAKA